MGHISDSGCNTQHGEMKWKFPVSFETQLCHMMFFWKLSHVRMFLPKQTRGKMFAENRHMVFFWKLPGKGACDVLLDRTLERTHDV